MPKWSLRDPKWPELTQKWSKITPKWPYFGPTLLPKWPYIAPDWVKNGSKRSKRGEKWTKNRSKVIQTFIKLLKNTQSTQNVSRCTHSLHTFIGWNVDFDRFFKQNKCFIAEQRHIFGQFCIFLVKFGRICIFLPSLASFCSILQSTPQSTTKKSQNDRKNSLKAG